MAHYAVVTTVAKQAILYPYLFGLLPARRNSGIGGIFRTELSLTHRPSVLFKVNINDDIPIYNIVAASKQGIGYACTSVYHACVAMGAAVAGWADSVAAITNVSVSIFTCGDTSLSFNGPVLVTRPILRYRLCKRAVTRDGANVGFGLGVKIDGDRRATPADAGVDLSSDLVVGAKGFLEPTIERIRALCRRIFVDSEATDWVGRTVPADLSRNRATRVGNLPGTGNAATHSVLRIVLGVYLFNDAGSDHPVHS